MELHLRKATKDDVELIFNWANDEVVRKNSFSTEKIEYEEHVKWFENLLQDENRVQLILERALGDKIESIGQIRLNMDNENCLAEVGYSIASEFRGMGYGKQMLCLAGRYIEDEYPHIKKLIARVKPNNVASIKAFENVGFKNIYSELECDVDKISTNPTKQKFGYGGGTVPNK